MTWLALVAVGVAAVLVFQESGAWGLLRAAILGTAGVLSTVALVPVFDFQMRGARYREVRRVVMTELEGCLRPSLAMTLGLAGRLNIEARALAEATSLHNMSFLLPHDLEDRRSRALNRAAEVLGLYEIARRSSWLFRGDGTRRTLEALREHEEFSLPALAEVDAQPEVLRLRIGHLRRATTRLLDVFPDDRLVAAERTMEIALRGASDDEPMDVAKRVEDATRGLVEALHPYSQFASAFSTVLDHIEWDRSYPTQGGIINFGL